MAAVGYSVGKNWKKAASISVQEGIIKIAQLCASYVIAVPHCRHFLEKIATPNILEGVMEGCYVLKKELKNRGKVS